MADEQSPIQPELKPHPATARIDPAITGVARRFNAWVEIVGAQDACAAICDAVVEGWNLADFANANAFSYTYLARWLRADKDRAAAYDEAREDRADNYGDRVVRVAQRDCSAPVLDKDGVFRGTMVDKGKVAQARNEMDALKWHAGRMKARVWGDKVQVDATVDVRTATNDQLAGELRRLGLGAVADKLLPAGSVSTGRAGE